MPTYLTKSPNQTIALAKKLAKQLTGKQIIALQGNLGSGKTTFAKGLAKGLGIKNTITSPTFVLFKVYPVKHPTIKQLVHADCYRISGQEIKTIGLDEYLNNPQTILAIEWPDKIKKQPNWLTIKFTTLKNSNHRKIQLPKKLN
ncbi:MAG: tRNA (adenosine(37)-N6)-threonylcarbamoyltransferase complex ATPase subunit type 1 TsaE [Patescibacteria group bacterium]